MNPDTYITWGAIVVAILGVTGGLALWFESRAVEREKKQQAGKT